MKRFKFIQSNYITRKNVKNLIPKRLCIILYKIIFEIIHSVVSESVQKIIDKYKT